MTSHRSFIAKQGAVWTAVSLVAVSAFANSAEDRIANAFQAQKPVENESWQSLVQNQRLNAYAIQKGDTLWDLSKTFFGDGFYWSKLWAENPTIGNPHSIEPGQNLVFIGGTRETAPGVGLVSDSALSASPTLALESEAPVRIVAQPGQSQVSLVIDDEAQGFDAAGGSGTTDDGVLKIETESGEEVAMRAVKEVEGPTFQEDLDKVLPQDRLESGAVLEENEVVPRPLLPPPAVGRARLIRELPRSFVESKPRRRDRNVTISKKERLADEYEGAVVPSSVAYVNELETIASVQELMGSESIGGFGQAVLLEAKRPLDLGQKVYSLNQRFDLKSPESDLKAKVFEIEGVMIIDDVVDTEKMIYRARIVYSESPIRVGSFVVPGEPKRIAVSTKGRKNTARMLVIGGGDSNKRKIYGEGAVIYLDRMGAEVEVGDELAIQARLQSRRKTALENIEEPVAIARVFNVDGDAVSAVLVISTGEVMSGDRTGDQFPTRLPRLSLEAPPMIE